MIIVKTKNGDRFINDKAVTMVEHDREKAVVNAYGEKGAYHHIEDVEGIIYTNDAQPTSWKDEGSEIQRLKATIEKKDKEPEKQDGVFVKNIVDLSCFSVRTVNVLYAADIRTIADLTKLQKVDVLKLRNAGKGTLSEINDFFEKYGLEWYNG